MTIEVKVLFDEECPFCRRLAEHAAQDAPLNFSFTSWQQFQYTAEAQHLLSEQVLALPADRLRLLVGSELFEGVFAWEKLIELYPKLQALSWIAHRLGLVRQAAHLLNSGGYVMRRICRKCPK